MDTLFNLDRSFCYAKDNTPYGGIFRKIYEDAQTAEDYDLFIGIESNNGGRLTPHSMGVKCGEFDGLLSFISWIWKKSQYGVTQNGLFHNVTEPFISNAVKIYPQDYFSPVTTYNAI